MSIVRISLVDSLPICDTRYIPVGPMAPCLSPPLPDSLFCLKLCGVPMLGRVRSDVVFIQDLASLQEAIQRGCYAMKTMPMKGFEVIKNEERYTSAATVLFSRFLKETNHDDAIRQVQRSNPSGDCSKRGRIGLDISYSEALP